ncbi:hypothetical protein METBIDRAFT_46784 [Metschnikowia bicuspidata var. bicuspidata NRRL YB-4993]|uniref:Zn(2)-C6 fungal-type domain-containing protein n=1 Tax=Metschnikowia bicuspidata var. bicuspidata NRRL YB-4993 TaxID=869754 RepID=A0A1A0H5N7_9ASCO|nr:hypothetical protein METBIDRAFT_46784 [Metschnikowia bicuspidata var. bicuspidata NRRL YB-4993]OBA19228.1 hypothetical protein METBIDRAFT_46784 [Metschnikowia bicuspidata var. bicuspidata NRRL YB-4993]
MLQSDSENGQESGKRTFEDDGQNASSKRRSSLVNHQRALKACEACRKGKTKCFKSSSVAVRCVRCTSSKLECLLELEYKLYNPSVTIIDGIPEHLLDAPTNQKLDRIYRGVSDILAIMTALLKSTGALPLVNNDVKLLLDAANSMKKTSEISTPLELSDSADFLSSSQSFRISPLSVVSNSIGHIPLSIANLLNLSSLRAQSFSPSRKTQYDIITCGILPENEVIALMDDFRSNYGRWVLFPILISTKILVNQIRRKSSLLLSTCCSLSLRYLLNGEPSPGDIDSHRRKKDAYRAVIKHLVQDLNKSLLKYAAYQSSKEIGEDVEFFQSMVILSIYSLSLSSIVSNTVDPESLLDEDLELRHLNLDPWYLSGLALSTFISKSTFGKLFETSDGSTKLSPQYVAMYDELTTEYSQILTLLRIYNHLILVHLVSCVLSGRMCLVDEIRLNQCTSALSLPSATNFDGRMVSEIGVLLITYNFIQINSNLDLSKGTSQLETSLEAVEADFQAWHEQWGYLFEQPVLQFGEFCFNFCDLQIVYNYVYYKGQANSGDEILTRYNGKEFCESQNLMRLLKHAADADLSKILLRSFTLTHFVTKVDNDSYFAYLSDQIHFFFFYGAISLVTTLKILSDESKLSLLKSLPTEHLGSHTMKSILKIVKLLTQKFEKVAQDNPNDIITQYKNGIRDCVERLSPVP